MEEDPNLMLDIYRDFKGKGNFERLQNRLSLIFSFVTSAGARDGLG